MNHNDLMQRAARAGAADIYTKIVPTQLLTVPYVLAGMYGWTPDEESGAHEWLVNHRDFLMHELVDGSTDPNADLNAHQAHIDIINAVLLHPELKSALGDLYKADYAMADTAGADAIAKTQACLQFSDAFGRAGTVLAKIKAGA